MSPSRVVLSALSAAVILGSAVIAQQQPPPPQPQSQGAGGRGAGGQGRGGGRGGGVPLQPNGECPPGMTEWRTGSCRAPEFPAPSIVDYRPRTTLKTEEHLVPKAKFPVVDSHNHTTITADNIEQMIHGNGRAQPARPGEPERRRRSGSGQGRRWTSFARASIRIASASSPTCNGTAPGDRGGPRRPSLTSSRPSRMARSGSRSPRAWASTT